MMASINETREESKQESSGLRCNYLVVGAGAAGMAFVDTMLTENPLCKIVLVDRRDRAGGHWLDSYPLRPIAPAVALLRRQLAAPRQGARRQGPRGV